MLGSGGPVSPAAPAVGALEDSFAQELFAIVKWGRGNVDEQFCIASKCLLSCWTTRIPNVFADGDTKGRFLGTKLDYVCITDALWYVTGIDFFNGSVATAFT